MRYNIVFVGTVEVLPEPPLTPDPTPLPDASPVTLEDAGVVFDPKYDRHQVDATTDEIRLVVTPASSNPARTPDQIKMLAFTAGSVPVGSDATAVAAMPAIATTELPVGRFGQVVGRLEGLPSTSYDLVILAGFPD